MQEDPLSVQKILSDRQAGRWVFNKIFFITIYNMADWVRKTIGPVGKWGKACEGKREAKTMEQNYRNKSEVELLTIIETNELT